MIQTDIKNGGLILMLDIVDNGIVLGAKRHGEKSFILTVFTENNGKYTGILHSTKAPMAGDFVHINWHARVSEQMGTFKIDIQKSMAAILLSETKKLSCLSCLCSLLNSLLPEREALYDFYQETASFLKNISADNWLVDYIRLERNLLSSIGFGMDLSRCAGGGDATTLCFVSPKTAKAVSREKGLPYADKLLCLPAFLYKDAPADDSELKSGLALTGYFLSQHTSLPLMRQFIL